MGYGFPRPGSPLENIIIQIFTACNYYDLLFSAINNRDIFSKSIATEKLLFFERGIGG